MMGESRNNVKIRHSRAIYALFELKIYTNLKHHKIVVSQRILMILFLHSVEFCVESEYVGAKVY